MSILQKQGLTSEELQMLSLEMSNKRKSSGATWLLWLFTGVIGGHRFYLGKTVSAIFMLITLGGFGFWTLIDLFLINGMIRNTNEKIENELLSEIRLIRQSKINSELALEYNK